VDIKKQSGCNQNRVESINSRIIQNKCIDKQVIIKPMRNKKSMKGILNSE